MRTVCLTALMLGVLAADAHALTATGRLDNISYAVYAPDWTWQKREINVLITLDNPGEAARTVDLSLTFPADKANDFVYAGPATISVTIPPGESVREAFTHILAKDGVPRQTYTLGLTLSIPATGASAEIPYPVQTVRGAAVSPGKWALFLPAGVALAWSIVFALALARMAKPSEWLKTAPPIDEPEHPEPWIQKAPN